MAHSLTRRSTQLIFSMAAVVLLGAVGTALAQSRASNPRSSSPSAVVRGAANSTAAIQNVEKARSSVALDTGRTAVGRNRKATTATGAATVSAAPSALALEDNGAPASTPEPLSVLLVGGALAGLYRMRRHIS